MGFGFSVGDFLAAIELANKTRKEFVNAPNRFKAISDECAVLHSFLSNTDDFNDAGSGVSRSSSKMSKSSSPNANSTTSYKMNKRQG
jgi:hypothetical protein